MGEAYFEHLDDEGGDAKVVDGSRGEVDMVDLSEGNGSFGLLPLLRGLFVFWDIGRRLLFGGFGYWL